MKSDPSKEQSPKTPGEGQLVIPCTTDQFGAFLSSLLGKPQTISKAIRGSFDITADDINDLHNLLYQRIKQQNESRLLQFTCRLVFDDNSSVLLNSLDEVMTYREVRPVASVQVHLNWSYLVQFEDRKTPEKQEIEVSFITHSGPPFPTAIDDETIAFSPAKLFSGGLVTFTIKHTARTWGADIEALLSGHIKNLLHPPTSIRKWLWRHSGKIGTGLSLLFFAAAILVAFLTANSILHSQQELIKPLLGETIDLKVKVDFVLNHLSRGIWARYFYAVICFLVVSLAAAILLGIWADNAANHNKPSFIVMTKEAEKKRTEALAKYSRSSWSFWASIVISILTGIVSNVIFSIFWKQN